jgi:hypothetical protein
MTDLSPVRVGDCLCPNTPHPDGDFVSLRPNLDLRGGFRVKRRLIDLNKAAFAEGDHADIADLEIALAEAYLTEGVFEWTLVDEEGPIPITPETLRDHLFNDYSRAEPVADKADDLYRPAILDPLVERGSSSSPSTPNSKPTSPTNGAGKNHLKRSKRSSTITSLTEDTAKIT